MNIIEGTTEFYIKDKTAVAIGKFDGFHRGHQKLLGVLDKQKSKGLKSVVFTFVPSPAAFFCRKPVKELFTMDEKRRIFRDMGVDYLVEYPFYQQIADMEPQLFLKEVLSDRLNAGCVVAGEDVSYGRLGAGDYKLLQKLSTVYGYEVIIVDKVSCDGREISSTSVREEVKNGSMEQVARLLGAPYQISGEIVHGRQLGRTIGMPTVNLLPSADKLLPPNGVYYSYVSVHSKSKDMPYDGIKFCAITNIGTKPTVDNRSVLGVETYIYDFHYDVYGNRMDVFLLGYRRPEMRFDGVDALKSQMAMDIEAGRRYHRL